MEHNIDHDALNEALERCGATWDAAQTHGLLTGRLAVGGTAAAPDWLAQVLEGTDESDALRHECGNMLDSLYQVTYRQLSERFSGFTPLLPDDDNDTVVRTAAMAHWCEGFLHGLVSATHGEALSEPLSDIIRDLLQITRAEVGEDVDAETSEAAYTELVEYLRVAAQLTFEELAVFRRKPGTHTAKDGETLH